MSSILPPTPVMDSLAERYGGVSEVLEMFFDENLEPLPDAPEELKRETKMLRRTAPPKRASRME